MTYEDFKYENIKWNCINDFSKNIKVSYDNICPCVFDVISDSFYRENYHSDILSYYFSFNDSKKQLISWINKKRTNNKIKFCDYKDSEIPKREAQKRDITIYSKDKTHAIVIENKSNGFSDMSRQLIRYYNDLKKQDITVDAIIYLNKYSIKEPDYTDWKKSEINVIQPLLLKTQLVGSDSITEKVINEVIKQSEDKRLIGLSIELRDLFNNIINGGKIMADKDVSKFLELMRNQQKKENLEKLVDAYNCLPALMRDHYKIFLEEEKNVLPRLDEIGLYKDNCLFVNFNCYGKIYYIDFWFSYDCINIILGSRNYDNWKRDLKYLKQKMESDWIFEDIPNDDCPMISFSNVYDESAVKDEMRRVITTFSKYIDK